MNLFEKFLSKIESKSATQNTVKNPYSSGNSNVIMSPECKQLRELSTLINSITSGTHYVARSEYMKQITEAKRVVEYFNVLKNSGMLGSFCAQNGLTASFVNSVLSAYDNVIGLVDRANDNYVAKKMEEEKVYLDNILKDSDPNILLDDDQRKVVFTDEDYCLVIAGAGAGKTTTVAAKVKYLVEKRDVKPEQILVVSFTNKAVNELKTRLQKELNINCPVATFHSTGNAILHIHNPEKLNIVEENRLYYVVMDYFKEGVLSNESMVNNLIRFFASYFDAPYEGNDLNAFFNQIAKANFSTMRGDLENFSEEVMDHRTKKMITIQGEFLRSFQEVEIANYLYLNNIDYQYEPIYRYNIPNSRKPYTPDFIISQGDKTAYIEHFGITEDGRNSRFSNSELEYYKQAIQDKIELHKQHGTTLLYTYSEYKDHKSLTEHLRRILDDAGFELKPRPQKEIVEKLISSEESRYVRKLVDLICRFISNFKVNGYNEDEFNRMYHSTQNVRTRLFLDICNDCYLHYQRFLKENDAVDFQDMINESARLLTEVKELGQKLDFKYIIVDEYQDISRQRFDLVRALADVTDAKIIAVGDDWQSIYAFSGSDITLFTQFAEKMGYAKLLKIENTYRNSQEVIDIAGTFIQKNDTQIKKTLRSPKHIKRPVIIYTYSPLLKGDRTEWRSGVNYATAAAVERALAQIVEFNKDEKRKSKKILLLGRFNFDGDQLEKSGLFEYERRGGKVRSVKYPELDITFMTAHSSKGLGYDEVIVVNGKNETYGFPSKIEDDPILSLVVKQDRSIEYAEERRLFYVAMTRTKNRVYFVAPEKNPSEFLIELKNFFKDVELVGNWSEEAPNRAPRRTCPVCGYPLQLRYHRSYGMRLYICTKEQELCGFMTNEPKAGKLSIMKCDECTDGYLVVKKGDGDDPYFLGCTNYKHNGTGCKRVVSKIDYYKMMKYAPDPEPSASEAGTDGNGYKKSRGSDNQVADRPDNLDDGIGLDLKTLVVTPKMRGCIYRDHDLSEILATILMACIHISQVRFYGVFVLNSVLHGEETEKILYGGLNNVAEFGKLAWIPVNEVTYMINWLIDNHYLHQTKGQYPVLHLTSDTAKFNDIVTLAQLNKLKATLERIYKKE